MPFIDRTHLKSFLKEAARHPGPRYEGTRRNGSRLILERNPEPGVSELLTEVEPDGTLREHKRSFAPAPERAAGYPEGFPFLPDRPVSVDYVDDRGETTTITWVGVADPTAVTRQLLQMEIADGWEVERSFESDSMGPFGQILNAVTGLEVGIHNLKRGLHRRNLQHSPQRGAPAQVVLTETRPARAGRVVSAERGPGA